MQILVLYFGWSNQPPSGTTLYLKNSRTITFFIVPEENWLGQTKYSTKIYINSTLLVPALKKISLRTWTNGLDYLFDPTCTNGSIVNAQRQTTVKYVPLFSLLSSAMGQPYDELEQVWVWWHRPYSCGFKESVGPRYRPLQQVSSLST